MQLDGINHNTGNAADAPRYVEFYARALGLRPVKEAVNFDAPDVHHLYHGNESGASRSILTSFEFPHATPRQAEAVVGTEDGRASRRAAAAATGARARAGSPRALAYTADEQRAGATDTEPPHAATEPSRAARLIGASSEQT
jgi:catechol 2,3-dioxygenase-like lactoylglutathione lyase family enzyme